MEIGEIVKSIMGRDSGKYFVIIDISERFVYICNGKLRPLEKPKRKHINHIKTTNIINKQIKDKLQKKELNNKELSQFLNDFDTNKPSLDSKEV